ncbi:MAG: class 1 fructose-bisphosphatase [Deltaproteobacteria bacterium]|nr:class 1 fructose-bisphosphatase [Deltaproteobacteria bacterium]
MPQFEEGTTLDRFIFETTKAHSHAQGQFATLLQQLALAARLVSARVNRAGLAGILGATGEVNVQGEFVQKLDIYANEAFKRALEHPGVCCAIVSEEDEEPFFVPERFRSGRYVVCIDPLDGSSNIDVNATIGTIFGVFRRKSPEETPATQDDILQQGKEMVAAGYIIYGSGTVFVISTGDGVHAFTLDPSVGEFFLSHPNIVLEDFKRVYSVNEGYAAQWDPKLRTYIESLKDGQQSWRARYIGSLVADFHRNLLKGGVFMYPGTQKTPQGKLRLLYEGFPIAFLAEAAGGKASDGTMDILDKTPTSFHERTPLFVGNSTNVDEILSALHNES